MQLPMSTVFSSQPILNSTDPFILSRSRSRKVANLREGVLYFSISREGDALIGEHQCV